MGIVLSCSVFTGQGSVTSLGLVLDTIPGWVNGSLTGLSTGVGSGSGGHMLGDVCSLRVGALFGSSAFAVVIIAKIEGGLYRRLVLLSEIIDLEWTYWLDRQVPATPVVVMVRK